MNFLKNFAGISQNNYFSNFDEPDNFGENAENFAENLLHMFGRQAVCKITPPPRGVADINLNSPGHVARARE